MLDKNRPEVRAVTVKTFRDMGRCEECEWFNPYDGGDGSPGECWRFPHNEVIERPGVHACAEFKRAIRLDIR